MGFFSQLLGFLAGAPQAANTAGNYYNQALDEAQGIGSGSLASTYGGEEKAALQPDFKAEDQSLGASLAAQGITNSGAAKAAYGNLAAGQSGKLAGALAPFYSQAEGIAGNIHGQRPGAQVGAYNDAISQFMTAASDAAGGYGAGGGVPGGGAGTADRGSTRVRPTRCSRDPNTYDASGGYGDTIAPGNYGGPVQGSWGAGPSINPYSLPTP